MSDDKPPEGNKTKNHPPDGQKPKTSRLSVARKIGSRKISREELDKILESHKKWRSNLAGGERADLSWANFTDFDFHSADLGKGNLTGADLRGANFQGANLYGAELRGANLRKANLQEADLRRANLQEADLRQANLRGADIQGAKLRKGRLGTADFSGANLKNADLIKAQLQGSKLTRTDLRGVDLIEANLHGADLSYSDLREANLYDADLGEANLTETLLQEANLTNAIFTTATLTGADFRHADLSDAKLSAVKGLRSEKLGGAILINVEVPKQIEDFEGLGHVEQISKHARNIFLAMVGGCVFSWLTIATTTDLALLANSGTTPLPIIQTPVPIIGFYWVAPWLLLTLYLYLHLYLQRLWEGMASLPAIFPDSRTLDERAFPWMLSGLVHVYVPLLKFRRPSFWTGQWVLSVISAWLMVPGTIGFLWWRHLYRHDAFWANIQIVALAFSIFGGMIFYRRARETLRGLDPRSWNEQLLRKSNYWVVAMVFSMFWVGYAFSNDHMRDTFPFKADLRRAVSENADLFKAYLVGADLRRAELKKANLEGADLREAVLIGTDLQGATLQGADLRGAQLQGANLEGANLQGAKLQGASLVRTRLKGARLIGANFKKADLQGADLQEASLQGVNLAGINLEGAKLQKAKLWEANLQGANLKRANLEGARLLKAKLQGADLKGANLDGANLEDADLTNADFSKTWFLKQEQINKACADPKNPPKGIEPPPDGWKSC